MPGAPGQPYENPALALADETWDPHRPADYKGGGTVWGFLAYDQASNLIYYGTSNPGPWNPEVRPGLNKWTSGVFARDLESSTARVANSTAAANLALASSIR